MGVTDGDICAVYFTREGIVAVVDGPVAEEGVRRIESVDAVGICWAWSVDYAS